MNNRLSWRLAAVITLGIALVQGIFGYLRVEREVSALRAETINHHAAIAHALRVAASSTAKRTGPQAAMQLIEDADLETDRATIRWLPLPSSEGQRWTGMRSSIEDDSTGQHLVTRTALALGTEEGVLEVREDMDSAEAYVRDTIARSIVMTLVLILLCMTIIGLAGWILIQRPMVKLLDKVERIGRGDLSGPIQVTRRDELGMLALSLNENCERLHALQRESEQQAKAKVAALEQLRHADRLNTVGKMAAGVAHELGTPLNVVSARAKMISRLQSRGPEAIADAVVIAEQADRMTGIIRQLLGFARLRKPNREECDSEQLCSHALKLLEPLATKSGVHLEMQSPTCDCKAQVDAVQMQQVLTNLVLNGIQAQPTGGVVRVSLSTGPELEGGRESLLIEVEDEGGGMAAEVKERVFEPFFTTKDVGSGTGLGLSVAYGIVKEHDGFIEFETEEGRGSRFAIVLPRYGS